MRQFRKIRIKTVNGGAGAQSVFSLTPLSVSFLLFRNRSLAGLLCSILVPISRKHITGGKKAKISKNFEHSIFPDEFDSLASLRRIVNLQLQRYFNSLFTCRNTVRGDLC